ncbi:DUF1963 domain-containing protein [Nonomuraea ceibae]|uniref:DUF1963 domain-containing protein n=1 Tax=Nonomuraea ceibae TaxID=1935170 RepID=UPI001C5E145E|nr:DUF1963 domain-containing protein [Nonomuraea ceibae]
MEGDVTSELMGSNYPVRSTDTKHAAQPGLDLMEIRMTPEMLDKLGRFRERALAKGIPLDDVERWTGTARPCATLRSVGGDGPVVGRLGGALLLPADVPDPWCKLAATVDLAALPEEATDLPLPPDGHLLLFACPDPDMMGEETLGSALYVPAGTPVEERQVHIRWDPVYEYHGVAEYPAGQLRLSSDISLPCHSEVHDPGSAHARKRIPGHPYAAELVDVWLEANDVFHPGLQLGGYARDEYHDEDPAVKAGREATQAKAPGELPQSETGIGPEDWVCLAQWWHYIRGMEWAEYSWSIARQDLEAGRFDRVYATMTWSP